MWQDWGLAAAVSPLHQHGGDRGQLRQVLQIFLPDNLLCDQHRVLGPLPQRALIICTVLYCTVLYCTVLYCDQHRVLGPLPQRALIIWLGQKLKIIIDSFSFSFALYLFLCYLLKGI